MLKNTTYYGVLYTPLVTYTNRAFKLQQIALFQSFLVLLHIQILKSRLKYRSVHGNRDQFKEQQYLCSSIQVLSTTYPVYPTPFITNIYRVFKLQQIVLACIAHIETHRCRFCVYLRNRIKHSMTGYKRDNNR